MKHLRFSDIRGVTRLAAEAIVAVSRIAEGVHQSVLSTMGLPGGKEPGQAGGVTGMVYRGVRGVTSLAGGGLDAALTSLERLLETDREAEPGTPRREAVLAALNGVMGDRLAADESPFSTPMTVRFQGSSLDCGAVSLLKEATGKILLLVHGLCMNDLQWRRRAEDHWVDHGEGLASALGYTPLYLRYNTGLHTSENGRELGAHLERLVESWPKPIQEITILAHSIGGLVTRSAVHYADKAALSWPPLLKNIVFLGTPHQGAPLEQAGNWVDLTLGAIPFAAPFARLGRLRSSGITDLRHGYVLDEHWRDRDRFRPGRGNPGALPLPEGVRCFAVAATTAAERGPLADRLTGDGLVPLRSALGEHDDPRRRLAFPAGSQKITHRTNHMELLSSPEVSRQLVRWLGPG